jgi:hypothetical protein
MVGVRGSIPLAPTISYNLLSVANAGVLVAPPAPLAANSFGRTKQNEASTKTCGPCETRVLGCPYVHVLRHIAAICASEPYRRPRRLSADTDGRRKRSMASLRRLTRKPHGKAMQFTMTWRR